MTRSWCSSTPGFPNNLLEETEQHAGRQKRLKAEVGPEWFRRPLGLTSSRQGPICKKLARGRQGLRAAIVRTRAGVEHVQLRIKDPTRLSRAVCCRPQRPCPAPNRQSRNSVFVVLKLLPHSQYNVLLRVGTWRHRGESTRLSRSALLNN